MNDVRECMTSKVMVIVKYLHLRLKKDVEQRQCLFFFCQQTFNIFRLKMLIVFRWVPFHQLR